MNKGQCLTFFGLFDFVEAIEIPILQRDYAQGREEALDVRTLFLSSLHDALLVSEEDRETSLDLDFVYGSFEGEDGGVFSVLDGQQRLTTLFLLHWFLALKSNRLESFRDKFVTSEGSSRFRYKTRHSSTEFFNALTSAHFETTELDNISGQICDSQWFYASWIYDPTVQSCLCMLDAISSKFKNIDIDLYERLTNTTEPYITFQYLNLHSFKLSDDLYIKMNARGKPLTAFENFKAWLFDQVENELSESQFEYKVDQQWTDIFWKHSVEENVDFDMTYLKFFNLIAFFHGCETTVGSYTLLAPNEKSMLREMRDSRNYIPYSYLNKIQAFKRKDLVRITRALDFIASSQSNEITDLFYSVLKTSNNVSLAKFYALLVFTENAPDVEAWNENTSVQLSRWMRVTDNLINNHRLDDMSSFIASIKALHKLSEYSQSIYEGITHDTFETSGFTKDQWHEEIVKALLILSDNNWELSLKRYEQHSYLNGKLLFILVMAKDDNDINLSVFENYADKVSTLLSLQVLNSPNHLLQRALLSLDNYLIEDGYNRFSFGMPNNTSYRDRAENWFKIVVKPSFKALVDQISGSDLDSVNSSLQDIINSSRVNGWRELIVKNPEALRYCKNNLIHKQGEVVYLLSKTNRRGYHAELYSFVLNLKLQSMSRSNGLPDDITLLDYEYVYGDETPKAKLKIANDEFGICFKQSKYAVLRKTPHPEYPSYLVDAAVDTPENIMNLLLSLGIAKDAIA
ncbi:DUF262 domain-containing protein [Vibrio alginolyticus]|uniref:DUF262 domain-containing protein n=1 Tax=Vibrio alginolyticus TaxID=663 RepID=UPI00215C112D|nr:DUF262 domain-containing protein [Vibrio alginolyticus]MCR9454037.1 DUF262 domain-containing protein [Vibrio alginolyticus]MCR9463925.1 DUF262 domain-containing protein [Vibrio alginolyticus]